MFPFRPFGLISTGTHLWTESSVLKDTAPSVSLEQYLVPLLELVDG